MWRPLRPARGRPAQTAGTGRCRAPRVRLPVRLDRLDPLAPEVRGPAPAPDRPRSTYAGRGNGSERTREQPFRPGHHAFERGRNPLRFGSFTRRLRFGDLEPSRRRFRGRRHALFRRDEFVHHGTAIPQTWMTPCDSMPFSSRPQRSSWWTSKKERGMRLSPPTSPAVRLHRRSHPLSVPSRHNILA